MTGEKLAKINGRRPELKGPEVEMDVLESMQDWYLSMCNGDWGHTYGIKIENIDNPGWAVTIKLMDTPLYQAKFDAIEIQRAEDDWILCRVEDGIFKNFKKKCFL
jgi:hypothetical protein